MAKASSAKEPRSGRTRAARSLHLNLRPATQVEQDLAAPVARRVATRRHSWTWHGKGLFLVPAVVDPNQYALSVLIASQLGQYGNNWPALMSIAVATGLPILAIFLVSYRRLREGLALGSAR